MLETFAIDSVDELRTTAAAASNLLGVPTTPRGTYDAVEITQSELHWGVREVFWCLARTQPLILVIEDLHWAEPTMVEFARFLIDDEADAPLLIVASGRHEFEDAFLTAGERTQEVRLPVLSDEAARGLLRQLLGSTELADSPVAARLVRTTGGNPLFIEETVHALRERGLVDHQRWHIADETAELPIPTNLRSLIVARLDQMSPAQRRIAQDASVIGAVFWSGALAQLQGDAVADKDKLVELLRALEQKDLVREHAASSVAGEREFEFKHILIRDVAYEQVPKSRRAELHLRFADWVEALPATADEFSEIIAHHLEQVCRLTGEIVSTEVEPPVARAVRALRLAGEKAEAREGMREADRFYARGLDFVDGAADQAIELRLRRANVMLVLGHAEEAHALLERAQAEVELVGRQDMRCEALILRAVADQRHGRSSDARQHLREALVLAIEIGDRVLEARSAATLASVEGDLGDVEAALHHVGTAIGLAEEVGDRTLQIDSHLRTGFLLYNLGDLAGSEKQLRQCSSLAEDLGSARKEAIAEAVLGMIAFLRGDLAAAEQLGGRAGARLERSGDTYIQIQNLVCLAQYALALGNPRLAEERLREALPRALAEGSWLVWYVYRFLTEAALCQGRVDDARELLESVARTVPDQPRQARASLLLGEAAVAAADHDAGLVVDKYTEALEVLGELDLRVDVAMTRISYGRALRNVGDPTRALDQLELARDACIEMGAHGLTAEADRELALVASGRSAAPGSL